MRRHLHLPAALLLVAVLAGCGSDPEPAAAPPTSVPAATSAAPSPSADERAGCRAVGNLGATDLDPATNRAAGELAMQSSDANIKQAGVDLIAAANDALAEPGPAANLAIAEAQLDVANACGAAYGDGPW
ncbi:hypothetical protein OG989_04020 [Micromonospora sp. NBC_01740]|uniref:hypothetical protein n=1 Tax=Micromonospora sp. NBC_01740 TaxID=2975986 RepID=UPI002E0D9934|nr:hypothetical protein OG989_04020 [Micromonospora sp. NBC_01740]